MSGNKVVRMQSVWICSYLLFLSLSSLAVAANMGHVASLSLKESVIRNHNGVMVMTLSPSRRTVLSLNNGKSLDGTKSTRQKPTVIFAKAFPSRMDKDLLENQTEAETNPFSGFEFDSENHEEWQQTQKQFREQQQHIPVDRNSVVDNEIESLLSHSALRNASGSIGRKRSEIGQVWVSKEDSSDTVSAEENDFQSMIAGFLKREIWTIPLFVFASLNIVLVTFFEIYVLCRTKGRSREHLFLGQLLLFGLFLCSTLALLFAIYPSTIICFVCRIGIGLAYSLVFAVLMVKCMFLLCLDVGVYIPTGYQGCLLFFTVLVQLVLDTQWVLLYPPVFQGMETIKEESLFLQCGTSYPQQLYSLWYIAFLILFVGFLAAKATFRGIMENYRESIYILMSIIVSVPISISWILAGWILEGRHQDACVAFGLVATSLSIFLIMFMPKGRQLAAMGKELAYDEDDQFSGYSPSFFHFKPTNKGFKTAMLGDGNLYTTLEPTLSTINPNVFFHRADYHSGMIY